MAGTNNRMMQCHYPDERGLQLDRQDSPKPCTLRTVVESAGIGLPNCPARQKHFMAGIQGEQYLWLLFTRNMKDGEKFIKTKNMDFVSLFCT
jgi:hypothetical protein